jgi:hypothetical protein
MAWFMAGSKGAEDLKYWTPIPKTKRNSTAATSACSRRDNSNMPATIIHIPPPARIPTEKKTVIFLAAKAHCHGVFFQGGMMK